MQKKLMYCYKWKNKWTKNTNQMKNRSQIQIHSDFEAYHHRRNNQNAITSSWGWFWYFCLFV